MICGWMVRCSGVVLGGMGMFSEVVICFFQAEDGIRDAQESRGVGDVYKRPVV